MIVLNVIYPMDGTSKMTDNVLNHVQVLITETFLQENVRIVTQVVKHVLINMNTAVQAVPLENTYIMVIVYQYAQMDTMKMIAQECVSHV